ncbi:Aspartyl/Asparaginyl beta-hydroxylase [Tsuneonella dongtanensis]|uniref:Aspartyl/Asparaginyl beta-hydroxylase n=1 Tax=Tsuneonella dongtanensis TaxID=692370 RepID=A0A1B2AA02_9SPHN|nr:aspartyl/asparaginyl beta-hydroxylase domain-containing protein [Tsuneonella dongtanensis]ANY19013.1 Aspartyl/Asparaginyl beta-hydroxylase [Tsuneonella dongtanensis]
MTPDQRDRLDTAVAAFRDRQFGRAADGLRQLASELAPTDMPWELLANAEAATGDRAAAMSALDRRLALDIRSVPALLLKAQLLEQDGDSGGATSHYQAALNQNAVSGGCPEQLRPLLEHGQAYIGKSQQRYAEYLRDTIGKPPSPRLAMALDLMAGKREVFLQQPSVFYFPELPQRQFYEPAEFPWLEPMLALVPRMQAELEAVENAAGAADFTPYVKAEPNRPAPNNPLLDDPAWGAFYFWRGGERVAANADRCPATMAALELAPMPRIDARSPVSLWSRLLPGAHIRPHHGMLNTRLICHIPIRTAPGCTLRVGNEVREWRDGVPLVFDDSIEHEARNDGDRSRTVLLFEIWRPEIAPDEREALARLFATIAAYNE